MAKGMTARGPIDATATYRADAEAVAANLAQTLGRDGLERLAETTWVVVGGTGQLGAATVDVLDALSQARGLGLRVVVAARREERLRARFAEDVRGRLEFSPYEADRGLAPDLLRSADFVVFAAGYGDPRSMMEDPVGILRTNVRGVGLVLESLAGAGKRGDDRNARLVFVSSGEVYGRSAEGMDAFAEDYSGPVDTMETRSCYPTAKRAAESLCRSYVAQYGVEAVVARQCHAFGPGCSARDSRVSAVFARTAADGVPIVLKSAGAQVRSWCHELDAAGAYVALAVRGEAGRAYNVAPAETCSIREFAEGLARAGGTSVTAAPPTDSEARGFTNVERAVLDATRLRELGWRQALPLERAFAHTVACLRETSGGLIA